MGRKKEQEHKTLARWIIDKTNTDHYRAGMLSGWKHPYIDADVMEIVGGRKQLLDQATQLVVDNGRIIYSALDLIGKDEKWLMKELGEKGMPLKDVYICTADPSGQIVAIRKDKGKKKI